MSVGSIVNTEFIEQAEWKYIIRTSREHNIILFNKFNKFSKLNLQEFNILIITYCQIEPLTVK